ncbi:acetate--CoA ligase family protein [Caballeronia sp. LZ001]|uniref:acetate--CoA ligase family protein n=1 Tax=Caballeronia sp. LZ001 TaxID=3038553 RepID=UPI002866FEEB|nr:acetate--CoA ligase family protein [Caballeronia sp. LZ001]MDR5804848.1 acetate--CoA ligase family protein [Caballeronia sp. LZ001]
MNKVHERVVVAQPPTLDDRGVYRYSDLRRVLAPGSVAVLGASPRAGSFGERTLKNLAAFQKPIYAVNAKYDEILGQRCYASVADLPEVPDCAFIAANRDVVESLVLECANAGVGGVVVYAAGYAETGKAERQAQQQRLRLIAREHNIRIIGPNCIGIFNFFDGMIGSFAPGIELAVRPAGHAVGIASQSGAMGIAMLQAAQTGTSFSHILTSGNSVDVDVADYVAYLAEAPECRAIGCLFEGMAQPARMLEAAQIAWENDKPLVIFKIATGEQGAQAALSHTGSLAGSQAAYKAAFERSGVIMVDNYEALVETTTFFAKAPRPRAHGVAVASTSGGASIMAADKAEIHGVALPQPHEENRAILDEHIPEFGSSRNPCDVTAQVVNNPSSLGAVGNALLQDDHFGALIHPSAFAADFSAQRMSLFNEMALRHRKPVCIVWLPLWQDGPGALDAEQLPGTALFRSMDRCFAALAAWHKREDLRNSGGADVVPSWVDENVRRAAAGKLGASDNTVLTERETKEILAAYGVPVVEEALVQSADDAAEQAARVGLPVVLKVESPDLPHKTEAGVIRLHLKTQDDVRTAYEEVVANAMKVVPTPRIGGVLVQPMIPPGLEIMVGAKIDPQFGPLIVVGLGGVFVELMRDTVVDVAPVSPARAEAMLGRLKGQAALNGFRGSEPVDRQRLAEIISRLSVFATNHSDIVAELDVNPLICAGSRVIVVDGLIARKS